MTFATASPSEIQVSVSGASDEFSEHVFVSDADDVEAPHSSVEHELGKGRVSIMLLALPL